MRIKKIQEKKQRHTWANQVMNELVQRTSSYKYDYNGQNPQNTPWRIDEMESQVPNPTLPDKAPANEHLTSSIQGNNVGNNSLVSSPNNYEKGIDQNEPGK